MTIVVYSGPATEPLLVAEVMAHLRLDASNQEPAPGAPTAALSSGAGNVDNGAHRYLVTFVTATGETQAGEVSAAVTVADKSANGKVALSAIPLGGSLVTARKLYRTTAGNSTYLLLATLADNSTTTYTDNIADASLGAGAPATNTTSDPLLSALITTARQQAEQELHRYLITQTLDAYFDEIQYGDICLPPLQSVTAITYVDTDGVTRTLDAADYAVDTHSEPARVTPAYGLSWPSTRGQANAVKVRFVAGYGDASAVPLAIKQWMLLQIGHWYGNRESSGAKLEPLPFVDSLLDPFRVRARCK